MGWFSTGFFGFFFHTHLLSSFLDKPWWSQVSSLLPPPGSCLQFLSRIGFGNPTAARRFFISSVAHSRSRAFRKSVFAQDKVRKLNRIIRCRVGLTCQLFVTKTNGHKNSSNYSPPINIDSSLQAECDSMYSDVFRLLRSRAQRTSQTPRNERLAKGNTALRAYLFARFSVVVSTIVGTTLHSTMGVQTGFR